MAKWIMLTVVLVLMLFALPIWQIPMASAQVGKTLVPFTGTLKRTFSLTNETGREKTDLGLVNYGYSQSAISFADTLGHNFTYNFPKLNGQLLPKTSLENSSTVDYQFTGLVSGDVTTVNVFIDQEGYQQLIIIKGTIVGLVGTIPLTMSFNTITFVNTTAPAAIACNLTLCFDWSTDLAFAPTYSNLTNTVTFNVGSSFTLFPLASDGNGKATCTNTSQTCSTTITTTGTQDAIVIGTCLNSGSETIDSVTSTHLTFSAFQAVAGSGQGEDIRYATTSSALTAESITVTRHTSTTLGWSIFVFGVSGAYITTGFPFDFFTNQLYSCTGTGTDGHTTPETCTIPGTSNVHDYIVGSFCSAGGGSYTTSAPFALINTQTGGPAQAHIFDIVAATQTNLAVSATYSLTNHFVMIAYAITGDAATVKQPVKISLAEAGAPTEILPITSCDPFPTTIVDDSTVHNINAKPSCSSLTFTTETDVLNARYRFRDDTTSTGVSTWAFTTCASGTCTEKDNTTYYQLKNSYTFTPQTPSTWDGIYTTSVTGTFVGQSVTTAGPNTANGGGAVTLSNVWYDYNNAVSTQSPIGNTWLAIAPNSFSDTTGGNTHNVNYVQAKADTGQNFDWLLLMPFILIGIVVAFRKRIR